MRSSLFLVSIPWIIAVTGCSAAGSGDFTDDGTGGTGGQAPVVIDPLSLPANVYSHGEPSDLEQELLEITQSVRMNPAVAGADMVELPSVQGAIQQYGVDTQKVISDFQALTPVPPLAFDPALMASSRFHSEDMAMNGFQEHDGSEGDTFDERITNAGYDWMAISENIFSYSTDPQYCNAAFCIDWGNPELGHRHNIMDLDGRQRDIGISIIEHPVASSVGPQVVTEDFGFPLNDQHRYLVGVAYTDANGNGIYDAGEGLGELAVVPSVGDTYAKTSQSGGFAIPMVQGAGAMKVQLQDATSHKVLLQADTSMAADNVKVDFVVP